MPNYLIAKLERYAELSPADRKVLEALAASNVKTLKPKQDLVRTGDKPVFVNLLLSGWAARYVDLEDGRRQIVGVVLPGDICDMRMFMLKRFDHSIGACTAARFAQVPRQELLTCMADFPAIERALSWNSLVEESIARAWIANVGQRTALERLAHLFVELFLRLRAVGLVSGNSCEFPLTQEHLADAVGLTSVHVNRSLMELRAHGFIVLANRTLTIPDLEPLMNVALFDPSYLHFER